MEYGDKFQAITELKGTQCVLRQPDDAIAPGLFEAIDESRSDLYEYMPWSNESMDELAGFLETTRKQHQSGTGLHLAVFSKRSNRLLGAIGLVHLSPFTPKGEVGYWIRSTETGNGYATDALRTLERYCRDELGFVRLDACVATSNLASQAVLRKCGFEQEGLKRKAMLCHGNWLDLVLMGKLLDGGGGA